MGESFNIYEFVNLVKTITPEELADMLLIPFCILLTALCVGQFINSLVENRLAKHFSDTEEVSLKYILLKAARGLPRAWIVGSTLYWLINFTSLKWAAVDLYSYILSGWLSFTLFQVLARAATGFIELYAQRHDNIPKTRLLTNIVNVDIYNLGILLILSSIGI